MKCFREGGCERLRASLAYIGLMLTGQARQGNERLVQRLAALRADYNQLRQDTDELLRYADAELAEMKQTNTGLAHEYDDLQLRVWELEQQVDELLLYIAQLTNSSLVRYLPKDKGGPNLSNLILGLVGGHEATRREVIHELTLKHGLRRWVEVPPTWESSLPKATLKGKLEQCDLIVIITGCMNHSLTHAVFGLKASGALSGEVVLLNFRGKSGVVREVLRYFVTNFEDIA